MQSVVKNGLWHRRGGGQPAAASRCGRWGGGNQLPRPDVGAAATVVQTRHW